MKWTEPQPPTKGISSYDFTTLDTPIGQFKIDWKSWKDNPDYDIYLNNEWLSVADSLEDAKEWVLNHIKNIHDKLGNLIKSV